MKKKFLNEKLFDLFYGHDDYYGLIYFLYNMIESDKNKYVDNIIKELDQQTIADMNGQGEDFFKEIINGNVDINEIVDFIENDGVCSLSSIESKLFFRIPAEKPFIEEEPVEEDELSSGENSLDFDLEKILEDLKTSIENDNKDIFNPNLDDVDIDSDFSFEDILKEIENHLDDDLNE